MHFKEESQVIELCKVFVVIIAWSYDDLKIYNKDVIQHTMELVPRAKPYQQKQRSGNP